jgi:hypothetical protein
MILNLLLNCLTALIKGITLNTLLLNIVGKSRDEAKFIQENTLDTTLTPLAKITGLRTPLRGKSCVNEDPFNNFIKYGVDIDIAGAYGNAFIPFGVQFTPKGCNC